MESDISILMPLLEAVPGVNSVTEGWPEGRSSLPLIALAEVDNAPSLFCDDAPMATHLAVCLRIVGYDSGELRQIAAQADGIMTSRGYERTASRDEAHPDARCKVIQYEKTQF